MKLESILVCPTDKTPLKKSRICPKCETKYENIEKIWNLYVYTNQATSRPEVTKWFDERAENIEDEQILRGAPYKWYKRFLKKDLTQIQSFLNLKDSDRFLDIGCGNGLFLKQYFGLVKEAVGTDISTKMLKRAKRHLERKNILLVKANSLELPFIDNAFDKILCNWVIHYFGYDELPKFFSELRRIANNNCRIFIGEIPLTHSFRSYEAKAGHFMIEKMKIKVSDRYISPVKTIKFRPLTLKNMALKAGFKIVSEGTMRHVLPSLRIPYIGQLVPARIQHLFERYDYKRSIPLISHSYFLVLG